jgi:hypothetical protein
MPNTTVLLLFNFIITTLFRPISGLKVKQNFLFYFKTDFLYELNNMYKSMFPTDHIIFYAVVQHENTRRIYLNVRTYRGKTYFCQLSPVVTDKPSTYMFRFRRTKEISNIRHLELWNIGRYEVYSPYPKCKLTDDTESIADFLNCDSFDEEAFLIDIEKRG